jgi:hypothetical protein
VEFAPQRNEFYNADLLDMVYEISAENKEDPPRPKSSTLPLPLMNSVVPHVGNTPASLQPGDNSNSRRSFSHFRSKLSVALARPGGKHGKP